MLVRGAIGGAVLLTMATVWAQQAAIDPGNPDDIEDPYIWLEDVEGEEALNWVEAQNEVSVGYL